VTIVSARLALLGTFAALLVSCRSARETYREVVGPEPGRHRVTVTHLALSESDFTNSALSTPKPVQIRVLKDGAEVLTQRVEGYRGPKDPGVAFEIDYDAQARYEFQIEEIVVMTEGKTWKWSSSKPGEWIFDDQRKNFGAGSSIEFRDEKIK
jgi:hypothetical protein